jgi:DNA-binding CsgD family transcriptional regulator
MSPGARLRAHQACAGELERRGSGAFARAHHVEHAAKHGDADAIALLTQAAAEAAGRAPGSAARWAGHALHLLPGDASPEQRLGLLLPLSQHLVAIGDLVGAREAAREAVDLIALGGPELEAAVVAACAGLEQVTGNHEAAERRLETALDGLDDDATRHGVVLLTAATVARGYTAEFDRMCELGDRTAAAGRTLGHRDLLASALSIDALAHAFAGRIDEAIALRDEATPLVDAMTDDELADRLDAIGNLAGTELYLERLDASLDHAARGLAVGRASGRGMLAPTLVPGFATAALVLGRLDDAVQVLEDAVERARLARQDQVLTWALLNVALVRAARGDVEAAVDAAEEASALANDLDAGVLRTYARHADASVRLEAGDPAGALVALRGEDGEAVDQLPGSWRVAVHELVARALLEVDPAVARAAAERAHEIGEEVGLPLARAWGRRALARARAAEGEADDAVHLARESAALAEGVGAVLDVAHALAIAGRAASDVDELRRAADLFDAAGAIRWRDQVEQELGRLGARTHRRSTAAADERGVAALTGRELEVARLVVDRRTNAEIAQALYLSTKTVETHLRNIFRKLDVSSRTEVARAVEAHDA